RHVCFRGVKKQHANHSMHVGFQFFASSSPLQSPQKKGKTLPVHLLFVRLEKLVCNQRRQPRDVCIRKVSVLVLVAPASRRRFFDQTLPTAAAPGFRRLELAGCPPWVFQGGDLRPLQLNLNRLKQPQLSSNALASPPTPPPHYP